MGNEAVQLSKKEEEGKEREKVRGGGTLSLGPTPPPLIERRERERERSIPLSTLSVLRGRREDEDGRTEAAEAAAPSTPPRSEVAARKKGNYHNNSR